MLLILEGEGYTYQSKALRTTLFCPTVFVGFIRLVLPQDDMLNSTIAYYTDGLCRSSHTCNAIADSVPDSKLSTRRLFQSVGNAERRRCEVLRLKSVDPGRQ